MMIPTLTSNPVHMRDALRRMRARELTRQRRRIFWQRVWIGFLRIFRPRPGTPE